MQQLFESWCDLLFTYSDGSKILCKTTLCQELLKEKGYSEIDGFVDISSGKIIPEEMFDLYFEIYPLNTVKLDPIDTLFQAGGKISWEHIY